MSRRITMEEFLRRARKIHGDKYNYDKVAYVNTDTPVEVVCPDHGSFFPAPGNHTYLKSGCPQCHLTKNRVGDIRAYRWTVIVQGAKRRGIPFHITREEAWNLFELQKGKCALTGWPIKLGHKTDTTASLDRIDSKKPYTIDNVQWLHRGVNIAKNSFSEDEFIMLCHAVAKHKPRRKLDGFLNVPVPINQFKRKHRRSRQVTQISL